MGVGTVVCCAAPADGGRIVGDDEKSLRGEILFLHVVSMFQLAAMQQMGKIPNPLTNEIERDLEQARMSVDILAMLKGKTKGNLTRREEEHLGKAVFESQMNYLDELKKSREEAEGKTGEKTGEKTGDKTGESACEAPTEGRVRPAPDGVTGEGDPDNKTGNG
jgi:hypothetical protein